MALHPEEYHVYNPALERLEMPVLPPLSVYPEESIEGRDRKRE